MRSQVFLQSNTGSQRVQQPVKVFYDHQRKKFRLCPLPEAATMETSDFGVLVISCGKPCDFYHEIITKGS